MNPLCRIAALHPCRKKSFQLLLLAEILLLCMGIAGLFGKNAVYEYNVTDMEADFGAYSEEYGGILINGSVLRGNMVSIPGIVLPRGTYQVQLHYVTDTDHVNSFTVSDQSGGQHSVIMNTVPLLSGLSPTDASLWLRHDSSLVVHIDHQEGLLAVQSLTVRETNAGSRILLFWMFCLFAAVNCIYLYLQYDRTFHIPVKHKNVTFCLGLVILAASVPLMPDYMLSGGDLGYHLMRVEGIKDNLLAGRFPARVAPGWQQGYGYASSVFYGETLLYPAAVLRMIGFTVTDSCRIFMFGITVLTVLIAYYCFRNMFRDAYIGVFCSMLYTLSVYRIYTSYVRAAWGECFGIMALPLLAYGFWRVFSQDIHEESYRRSWVPLTAGFSLLIQSHLLTGELAGFFTILLCIVLIRKVFRPRTFFVLAKAAICSVLLSAWFLIPFADYMMTGDFVIHHVSGRTIQSRGLYPAQLLFTYFIDGGSVFFDQYGMADMDPVGVGITLIAALVLLAYLWFDGKLKTLKQEAQLDRITAFFSLLAMLFSLNLFPWDRIQFLNKITATLISSIQFPYRFLSIANVCLVVTAGVTARYVMTQKGKFYRIFYFSGMTVLLFISSIHLTDSLMNKAQPVRVYNAEGMGSAYIAGAEYLPYGADPTLFQQHEPLCTEGLSAQEYTKRPLGAEAYIQNPGSTDGSVLFPLLYYKGYRCHDRDTGIFLNCHAGENARVAVEIPAGFAGNIQVEFQSPWYWRIGEAVTGVTLVTLTVSFLRRRRKSAHGTDSLSTTRNR